VCSSTYIYLLTHMYRPYVATLQQPQDDGHVSSVCVPLTRTIPKIRLRLHSKHNAFISNTHHNRTHNNMQSTRYNTHHNTLHNKRFTVVVDEWPVDSMFPLGHYSSTLGPVGMFMCACVCVGE